MLTGILTFASEPFGKNFFTFFSEPIYLLTYRVTILTILDKTLCLALYEHGLRILKDRVLRIIFGPRKIP
jgi:hypothetical protein